MSWDGAFAAQAADLNAAPAARPPATLGEVWDSEWTAAGLHTAFGVNRPVQDAYADLAGAMRDATGQEVDQLASQHGFDISNRGPGAAGDILNQVAANLPDDQRAKVAPYLDVQGRAREKAQAIERQSDEIGARTYGLSGMATAFAAGLVRQTIDPVNLAAMAVTAPFTGGASLPVIVGREFAVNAAAQAIQEPAVQAGRASLGLPSGFGEAARDIAMAGVGGAGIASVLRGGAGVYRRLAGTRVDAPAPGVRAAPGEIPPASTLLDHVAPPEAANLSADDLAAAAHYVERNEVFDAAAHDPTPEGRLASVQSTDETARAIEAGEPLPTTPVDDVLRAAAPVEIPRRAPPPPAALSINQFIARQGGLSLDDGGEAVAQDLHRYFVPGGGMLARRNGRSVDGFWREHLIENGYLPPDPDGGAARDIRDELYDAIARDRSGDRVYTPDGERIMAERGQRPTGLDREIEDAAKRIKREFGPMYQDGLAPGPLYDAAELLVRGHETDPLAALDRAFMERLGRDDDLPLAAAAREEYDLPFFGDEPHDAEPVGKTRQDGGPPRQDGGDGEAGRQEPLPGPRGDRESTGGGLESPRSEPTAAGEQGLIPGVAPVSPGEKLQLAADRPLRGGSAPAAGLFDEAARGQSDLLDVAARRADVERALQAAGGDMDVVTVAADGTETRVSARTMLERVERDRQAAAELTDCILRAGAA